MDEEQKKKEESQEEQKKKEESSQNFQRGVDTLPTLLIPHSSRRVDSLIHRYIVVPV